LGLKPYIDRIGRKMNIMERVIDIPQQDVISKDNATVTVDGIAFFQILDAAKASYEVAFLDRATVKLTMTNIRSVMGGMDLDQMLSHRDEINERLIWHGIVRASRSGNAHRDGARSGCFKAHFLEKCRRPTLHRVFGCLHRARPNDLSGGFSLKHRGLFCERVDTLSLFGGRLLDDDELGEAGDNKGAVLL
jgi:SPFH domain / Band 7 family